MATLVLDTDHLSLLEWSGSRSAKLCEQLDGVALRRAAASGRQVGAIPAPERATLSTQVCKHLSPSGVRHVKQPKSHSSRKLTPQKDGAAIGRLDLKKTDEVTRWVQSSSRHAVVLESGGFRAEVVAELSGKGQREAYTTTSNIPSPNAGQGRTRARQNRRSTGCSG